MIRHGQAKNRGVIERRAMSLRFSQRPARSHLSQTISALSFVALLIALIVASRDDSALAEDSPLQDGTDVVSDDPGARAQLSRSIDRAALERLALREAGRQGGQVYPIPDLHRIDVLSSKSGTIDLSARPQLSGRVGDRYASLTPKNNFVFYTVDPDLQEHVTALVSRAQASHVAIVAMNPSTGAILAIAGKSNSIKDIEYHAQFPAASLFKVVTAAAAVEHAGIASHSLVGFRGGMYTLNQWNYYPDPRKDRRLMSVGEALGRSCNPVFGHLGIKYLNGDVLARYANLFGFNRSLSFEAPLAESSALIPRDNQYELSRTSAGFGDVRISPIHAAALMSGIANGGLLPRPQIVDTIVSPAGAVLHEQRPEALQRIVDASTADVLMEMMRNTTTVGTSRREFMRGAAPVLGTIDVAGKTGTLSGDNPEGLNNWFIGAAPIKDPRIAVAVITVDPRRASKASHLARLVLQKFFGLQDNAAPATASHSNKKYRSYKSSRPKVSSKSTTTSVSRSKHSSKSSKRA